METVYIKKAPDYEQETLGPALAALLTNCGLPEAIVAGRKIVVKPNLLMKARPETAVTTHPAVVEAIVRELKRRGADTIVIADSPSGPFSGARLGDIYKTAGLLPLEEIKGVSLLREFTTSRRRYGRGEISGEIELIDQIADADLLINAAKLKTHSLTGMTAAVKNLFGAVPGLVKAEMHGRFTDKRDFCNMICCLALLLAPEISVVDAVVALEGDGPSGGEPRPLGFIAGSKNAFLLDRALAHIAGFTPQDAFTVGSSVSMGLAPAQLAALKVEDEAGVFAAPPLLKKPRSAATLTMASRLPKFIHRPINRILRNVSARPAIRRRGCVGCRRCCEICPRGVISIDSRNKAVIDRGGCIRCFCCHEVCPEKTIDIKRGLIWRL